MDGIGNEVVAHISVEIATDNFERDEQKGKVVREWTDASGQQRLISAVISVGDRMWYTNTRVSDRIWSQLQTRGDHLISVQEMLAVLLLLETFENELKDCLLLLWIDNNGVLGAARKGASKCMEVSLAAAMASVRSSMWICILGMWRQNPMWRMVLPVTSMTR